MSASYFGRKWTPLRLLYFAKNWGLHVHMDVDTDMDGKFRCPDILPPGHSFPRSLLPLGHSSLRS